MHDDGNFDPGEIGPAHPLSVSYQVAVFWPNGDQYYHGRITAYDPSTDLYNVSYYDGYKAELNIEKETWCLQQSHHIDVSDLSTIHKKAIELYLKTFYHKEFMLHQAEGLPPHLLWNAYVDKEKKFVKTVTKGPVINVPKSSNIISSHAIYNVKANDDGSLKLEARIAPYGNKDRDKSSLKTDSAQCLPTDIRILCSFGSIMTWPIAKIDLLTGFWSLQPTVLFMLMHIGKITAIIYLSTLDLPNFPLFLNCSSQGRDL